MGLTETLTGVRAFLVSILRCAAAIADSLMSRLETVCRRAGLLLVPLYEIKKLKSANA